MKTKNAASTVTVVRPKYGMARHKQQVRSGWAAERHKQRAGTARQSGKRGGR